MQPCPARLAQTAAQSGIVETSIGLGHKIAIFLRLSRWITRDQTASADSRRDRLIVIDGGRIFADGPRDQILGKLGDAAKKEASK